MFEVNCLLSFYLKCFLIHCFYSGTKRRKIGRPSIVSKTPDLITKLQEIISQGSTAAQSRWRDDVQYSFGVSLENMRKDDLGVTVSKHTIHRALIAPHQRWRTARLYKGYVHARVPPKSNCKTTKDHNDFRYTCVQVNLVNEFAALYSKEVLAMSCDDKNKINIGTPAVSRYCKFQSFFDVNSLPDLPDHDFPLRNSKITPSGYLILKDKHTDRRSRSISPPVNRPVNQRRRRSVSPPCHAHAAPSWERMPKVGTTSLGLAMVNLTYFSIRIDSFRVQVRCTATIS